MANVIVISSKYGRQFPWSLPLTTNMSTQQFLAGEAARFSDRAEFSQFLLIATAIALVMAALAIYELGRRDVV